MNQLTILKNLFPLNRAPFRNCLRGLAFLLFLLTMKANAWGQTTFFSYLNTTATIPTGWVLTNNVATNPVDQGSYLLLDAGNPSDLIVTPNYSLTSHTSVTLSYSVATFGSGTNPALKVEVSTDGGTTWSTTTYISASPTTSSYINGSFTITQTLTNITKFRFSNNITSGRGVRCQNLKLVATAPATSPILSVTGTTAHGTTCVNVAAGVQQYTITNSGTVAASGVTVTSSDPQFVVSALSSTTLAATTGTATYNVTFTPTSSGAKTATITIASSTTGSNSPTSSLTGTGTAVVAQAVTSSAATSVATTTTTLNGNLTTLGTCPSTTEKGFIYAPTATNSNPLVGGTDVVKTSVSGLTTGAFNLALTGLVSGQSYTFKAYAYDGTTYTYGTAFAFTTTATPPSVTAASNATVDAPFSMTFTDDATWRAAITGITVNGVTLSPTAYSVSAGQITFTPSLSTLLQSAGTKTVSIAATNYTGATISQVIAVGVATKLALTTQPLAPSVNGGTLATQPVVKVQDQYGNTVASTATITASVGSGTWTLGGTAAVNAVSGTATFSGLTATSTGAVTGATIVFSATGFTSITSSTFTIVAPAPANDECANASLLTPSTTIDCTSPTTGTVSGATQSYVSSCGVSGITIGDVWYKFVATSTVHDIYVTPSANMDAVIDFHSSGCMNGTSICADIFGEEGTEIASLTGLTVGATYSFRIYDAITNAPATSDFTVCVTKGSIDLFANTITGTTPNLSNPYTTGQTVAANLTVSGIGRGTGIAGASANDRYNSNGWTTSATLDANDYFYFTLTPAAGYVINFNRFDYNSQASSGSPTLDFRSSLDNYAATIYTAGSTGSTFMLNTTTYQKNYNPITFRLYGYGFSAGTATFSVNDFAFKGEMDYRVPTVFAVTGGGAYCTGGTGVTVGLANSETWAKYQLYRDGVAVGTALTGTGSAISFGLQPTAGTYTVVGINVYSSTTTATMSGSAVITINPLPTPSFITSSSSTCLNSSTTYTTQKAQSNYVWTVTGTANTDYSIVSGGTSATDSTVTLQWLTAGTKTVTVNYTNSFGCTATSSASVNTSLSNTITWIGGATGTWNTASNWCGGIPTSTSTVIIPTGSSVTLDAAATATNITVQTGASLDVSSYTFSLSSNGTFTNNGTFTPSTGTLQLVGAATLTGISTCNNFIVGGNVTLPSSFSVLGDLTLTNGTLSVGTGVLTLSGASLTRTSGVLDVSAGTVVFANSSLISLPANLFSGTVNNLTVNGGGVSLGSSTTLTGTLTLTAGNIELGSNDLMLGDATISGGSATSYVKSTSTGMLKRNVGSTSKAFPIGNSTYNPVSITNAGAVDAFGVYLIDNVTDNGTGVGTTTLLPVVKRTWMVSEDLAGGSDVTLKMQWTPGSSEEINSFSALTAFVSHYTNGSWSNIGGTVGTNYVEASGITSFSPFRIGSEIISPLPIELISFAAACNDNGGALLSWSTASERNNAYFTVETSADGINWSVLATLDGAGNSTSVLAYSFLDKQKTAGIIYYRLSQTDYDGMTKVFPVVAVNCGEEDDRVLVAPNPSKGEFSLIYTSEQKGTLTSCLMDMKGTIIDEQTREVVKGTTTIYLGNSSLKAGVYLLRLTDQAGKVSNVKCIVE